MKHKAFFLALTLVVVASVGGYVSSHKNTKQDKGVDFTYTVGDTYKNTKDNLSKKGWTSYLPEGSVSEDKEFPEIESCGKGIDAVCFVNFKKGEQYEHIIVQKGGRSNYETWVVIGQE